MASFDQDEFLHLSLYNQMQVTQEGEVGVEEGEGEGVNFASRLEVLHVLMAHEEIPKGVEVEDIGKGKNVVGVVEGLGNQMKTLLALCKQLSSFHEMCLMLGLCSGLFGELQFADHWCQKILDWFCFLLLGASLMKTPP